MSADDQIAKLNAPTFVPDDRPADDDNVRVKLSEGGIRPPDTAFERTLVQPDIQALPCTGCVIDAKKAAMAGATIPEPLPGTVMIQGMLLCDVRHTVDVQPPSLLIAQPGQIPGGLG